MAVSWTSPDFRQSFRPQDRASVDAACEPDHSDDHGDHQRGREDDLPQGWLAIGHPCRHRQRRRHRYEREDARQKAVRVLRNDEHGQEVWNHQHYAERERRAFRVLKARHRGADRGEGEVVEQQAEHEPQRSDGRNIDGDRRDPRAPYEQQGDPHPRNARQELGHGYHQDPEHLAGQQDGGSHRPKQNLDNSALLLFHHALQHPTAVEHDRHEEEEAASSGD